MLFFLMSTVVRTIMNVLSYEYHREYSLGLLVFLMSSTTTFAANNNAKKTNDVPEPGVPGGAVVAHVVKGGRG